MPCLKAPSSSEIPTGFGWGRGDRHELGCESRFRCCDRGGLQEALGHEAWPCCGPRGLCPRVLQADIPPGKREEHGCRVYGFASPFWP